MSSAPDIVITGVGLATCLGLDAETNWRRVQRGECGIGELSALETPLPPGKDGGQAPELPVDFAADLPREVRYLRWVLDATLANARLDLTRAIDDSISTNARSHAPRVAGASQVPSRISPSRVALLLGTTLHGMRAGGTFLRSNNPADLKTFLAGDTLDLAAANLAIDGARLTTCSACSSSLGAIALAVTLLQRGDADVILAGGYDTISEYVYGGFNALRLVSDPPLRPFTRGRCGMKLAEGYATLALETRAHAEARGATILATVAGWGESADAFHLTRPHPAGEGALAAMRAAIGRAGITAEQIDLIAAHATGTPDNDSSEAAAIWTLVAGSPHRPPVVGFKSHLGHTLGGAGAAELILSAMALRDGVAPPCASVSAESIEFDQLAVTHGDAKAAAMTYSLNTSLGFGGANTCVVLQREDAIAQRTSKVDSRTPSPPALSPVTGRGSSLGRGRTSGARVAQISGIGVLLPGVVGRAAFLSALDGSAADRRSIDDAEFEHLLNARRIRRMSAYVKFSLAAAADAIACAGLTDSPLLATASAILGTTHGSAGYSYDYYAQVVREGLNAANPMLFAEGVPNAAAAQLSLMLGLRGACQTIIGTRTAGLDALALAAARIEAGDADRIVVVAAEESHFTLDEAYRACDANAEPTCSAAAAFVVESAAAIDSRGGKSLATIDGFSLASGDRATRAALDTAARDRLHRSPVKLAGQTFSVEPLLALVAAVLRPASDSATVWTADRTGVVASVSTRISTTDKHG